MCYKEKICIKVTREPNYIYVQTAVYFLQFIMKLKTKHYTPFIYLSQCNNHIVCVSLLRKSSYIINPSLMQRSCPINLNLNYWFIIDLFISQQLIELVIDLSSPFPPSYFYIHWGIWKNLSKIKFIKNHMMYEIFILFYACQIYREFYAC